MWFLPLTSASRLVVEGLCGQIRAVKVKVKLSQF